MPVVSDTYLCVVAAAGGTPVSSMDGAVYDACEIVSTGQIIIVGTFTRVDGIYRIGVAALNSRNIDAACASSRHRFCSPDHDPADRSLDPC